MRLPLVGRLILIVADALCRSREGHWRREGDAGARPERLRHRPAPAGLEGDHHLQDRRTRGSTKTAREVPRGFDRFTARNQDRRRHGGARLPLRRGRRQQDDGPLRREVRSWWSSSPTSHRPMVGGRRDPGAAGDQGGGGRAHGVPAEDLGEDLFRVDAEHPALVRLAPALVGPPHPRLVRAGRAVLRRGDGSRGEGRRQGALRQGRRADPGRGCARHLVLVRPLGLLDLWVATEDTRDSEAASILPAP